MTRILSKVSVCRVIDDTKGISRVLWFAKEHKQGIAMIDYALRLLTGNPDKRK